MPTPLKPGETPEPICPFPHGSFHRPMVAVVPACLCEAIRDYGDRRGEEERAKALEEAAILVEKWLHEQKTWAAHRHHLVQQIRSLAAAPSGDAKGTK